LIGLVHSDTGVKRVMSSREYVFPEEGVENLGLKVEDGQNEWELSVLLQRNLGNGLQRSDAGVVFQTLRF
jgi:hypothetical protein